jgi:hypothetical protein
VDGKRFDDVVRAFAAGSSRRRLLGGTLAAAGAWFGLGDPATAACTPVGRRCSPEGTCCGSAACLSGVCRCQSGAGACPAGTVMGADCRCLCPTTGRPAPDRVCPCPDSTCGDPECCGCLTPVDGTRDCYGIEVVCTGTCGAFITCTTSADCPVDHACAVDPLGCEDLLCFPRCGVPFVGSGNTTAASSNDRRRR